MEAKFHSLICSPQKAPLMLQGSVYPEICYRGEMERFFEKRRRPGPWPPAASPHLPRPPAAFGLPPPRRARRSRACVLRPERPTRRPAPENAERVGGGAQEGRRTRGVRGWWAFAGGDLEDVTPRPCCWQTSERCARGCKRIPSAAASGGGPPESGGRETPSPHPQLPGRSAPRALGPAEREARNSLRLGARGRGRVTRGGRLGGRGRGRAPERVRGRGRGAATPRAAPGTRGPRPGAGRAMAAGSITTLPALPEDGGSGAFPPGHFKDPKRLYCKNGGFFLRIHPDGRVDGVREKSDPHVKLQLQAEERGVVSIKGVCANRYLAMKEDGRLLASKCVTDECFFFERLESNNYNTYRSRKYSSWYVALKRTGQYKLGPKTGPGQKAILFLPMSAKS
ncbi:fibroblast growth factor 2 [Mesoplodon densirostris]|nr:fibroblast growth factor 2 [Mesoplodon densirostris]